MAGSSGDRSSHFPAIEKKYGQPMSYWFDRMKDVADLKYPEQIAFLREGYGFTQAHANALVLYSRGSTTSKRFETFDDYLAPLDATKQKTIIMIFAVLMAAYPDLDLVIAWNQPMLKRGKDYVFGVSVAKNHINMAPWNTEVLTRFKDRLVDYELTKKTIRVPVDWKIDKKLLVDLLAEE